METIRVLLDDKSYDTLVHHELALMDYGDLTIASKDKCTVEGNPGVAIVFTVDFNGEQRLAQTVTTVRAFLAAARLLAGKYGELLDHGHIPEAE